MIGQQIQNYQITAHIGEGGMGTVYRATDTVLGRQVALKMLHTPLLHQAQFLDRFKKEARMLAQLLHPNIAAIYNFIEQSGNYFMVMEYVEGHNLDHLLRQQKKLSHQLVVPVFIQVLEGLRHAHKKGIFHRDIKPSNIVLGPDGTVKLMDFGIAIMAGEQRMTQVNKLVGTIEYMAPELIQGKEPSAASDLFSVGVTLYELLTGKLPFEGNTDFHLMQNILKAHPIAIGKIDASVPNVLTKIVEKALEKNPENRYAGAQEMQQELLSAFPHLKDVDVSAANSVEGIPATRIAPLNTQSPDSTKATMLTRTKTGGWNKAGNMLHTQWSRFWRHPYRKAVLWGITFLTMAVLGFALLAPHPDQPDQKRAETGNTDTASRAAITYTVNTPPEPTPVLLDTAHQLKETVYDEEAFEEPDKPTDKKKEKANTKKTDQPKKILSDSLEQTTKEPPSEVVPEEPKFIKIITRVPVSLYLVDHVDPETAQEGQMLHFRVTAPVYYKGYTIVEENAHATGIIKEIGRKKMSILFVSVDGANGQTLEFESAKFFSSRTSEVSKRKIKEVVDKRDYKADLKLGTRIRITNTSDKE